MPSAVDDLHSVFALFFIVGLPRDSKHLHSGRYTIGESPAPGQPVGFNVQCDGDDVMLTITELVTID